MIYFSKTGSSYADKVYEESELLDLFTNIDEGKSLKRFLDENIHCLKHGSETRYLIMINRIKLHTTKFNRILWSWGILMFIMSLRAFYFRCTSLRHQLQLT